MATLHFVAFFLLLACIPSFGFANSESRPRRTKSGQHRPHLFQRHCSCRCRVGNRALALARRDCFRSVEGIHRDQACQIMPCKRRHKSGFSCCALPEVKASNSATPSPSLAPTPSESVIPTPSPSTTSTASPSSSPSSSATPSASPNILRSAFRELTRITGRAKVDSGTVATDSGEVIDGEYDLEIVPEGVVSLDSAAEAIENLKCTEKGLIHVRFREEYVGETGSLAEMYPVGSIVAVNSRLFGKCLLGSPNSEDVGPNRGDGFLKVKSVYGTPYQHVIRGEPLNYFGMFAKSSFEFRNLATNQGPTVRSIGEIRGEDDSLQLPVSDRADFSLGGKPFEDKDLGISIALKGTISSTTSVENVKAESQSTIGAKIVYRIANEQKLNFELVGEFSTPDDALPNREFQIGKELRFPIYGVGVPVVPSGASLAKLPSFSLGIFLEIPVIVKIAAAVSTSITVPVPVTYRSGKEVYEVSLDIGTDGVFSEVTPISSEKSEVNFELPAVPDLPRVDATLSLFFGVRPTIMLEAAVINAGLSIDIGANIEGKFAGLLPLPAIGSGDNLFGTNDVCSECHRAEIGIEGRVENAVVSGELPTFDRTFEKSIPGGFMLSLKLAQFCFITDPLLPLACGSQCCSASDVCDSSGSSSQCSTPRVLPPVCSTRPTLRRGAGFSSTGLASQREAVRQLQGLLNEVGGFAVGADGLFGSGTEAVVRDWQSRNGLVSDGIVGQATWSSLC